MYSDWIDNYNKSRICPMCHTGIMFYNNGNGAYNGIYYCGNKECSLQFTDDNYYRFRVGGYQVTVNNNGTSKIESFCVKHKLDMFSMCLCENVENEYHNVELDSAIPIDITLEALKVYITFS
jgi:hypothetical protein